jgi:3-hydroxyisobutyrate dehydrogenase-like beta-hydroxyacid dehydrogenase
MGASLAQAFVRSDMKVTVWNRTASKAEPLIKAGAEAAQSVADAVGASPLIIVCATDAAASKLVYRTPEVMTALKGRTLADLSTGTAADAIEAASWVNGAGGRYLDGGILCYPRDIGSKDASILYAGDGSAFHEHESTLAILAGAQKHLGDAPGAAATVYLALWAFYFGSLTAYFEAGGLASTEGVPIDRVRELAATMMAKLTDGISDATDRMVQGNFAGDQAPIDIYVDNLILVRDTFAQSGVSHLTVDAFLVLLQEAKLAGDGGKDVAALLHRVITGTDHRESGRPGS